MLEQSVPEQQKSLELELIADIVSAYVANNPVPLAELATLIGSVADTLQSLGSGDRDPEPEAKQRPAVPIKKSVTPDYIISLEDGLKFKSLKRALAARYGLTPDEYRQKWGLPNDYPMVAPNYAAARSALAKKIGLGRKPAKSTRGQNKKAAA
jgi:predicted transcriptional regulator